MTAKVRGAAVVTGAAGGLGLAIAEALCRNGYAVCLTDVDGPAVAEAADRLGGWWSTVDVRDEEACTAVAAEAAHREGGLAVWVNNAGVLATGPAWTHDGATRRRVLEINALGAMNGTLAALAEMRAAGRGHVVNVVSLAGHEVAGLDLGDGAQRVEYRVDVGGTVLDHPDQRGDPEADRLRLNVGVVPPEDARRLQFADALVYGRCGQAHLSGQLGIGQPGIVAQQFNEVAIDRVHGGTLTAQPGQGSVPPCRSRRREVGRAAGWRTTGETGLSTANYSSSAISLFLGHRTLTVL